MFNCKEHGWYSFRFACPLCFPSIVTSGGANLDYELQNSERDAQVSDTRDGDSSNAADYKKQLEDSLLLYNNQTATIEKLQEKLKEKEETAERLLTMKYEDEQKLRNVIQEKEDEIVYWRERCEAAEKCYAKLNLSEEHKKEYSDWQQLKQKQ